MKKWDESLAMAGSHPDDAYVHHLQVGRSHIYVYETGFVKVMTHDKNDSNSCTFTMDSDGNTTLDSTSTITLKAKNIVLDGTTQIDLKSPNVKCIADVHAAISSPAIELDSSSGHTKILSRADFSPI